MSELLPCPFCGGEANVIDHHNDNGSVSVGCNNDTCLGFSGLGWLYKTEAEAIAAWNSRADYHGYEQAAIEAWESIKAWNSRAERTCECVAEYAESPIDGKKIVLHRCSACHELMRPHMRYCPNCGAKVVSE